MKSKTIYFIVTIIVIVVATITTNTIQERCMYISSNTSIVPSTKPGEKSQKAKIVVAPQKGESSYELEEGMMIIRKQTNTLLFLFFPFLAMLFIELFKDIKKKKIS